MKKRILLLPAIALAVVLSGVVLIACGAAEYKVTFKAWAAGSNATYTAKVLAKTAEEVDESIADLGVEDQTMSKVKKGTRIEIETAANGGFVAELLVNGKAVTLTAGKYVLEIKKDTTIQINAKAAS